MSRRLPFILFNLICIALVAWFFARATISLSKGTVDPPGLTSPLTDRPQKNPEVIAVFHSITTRNLLGVSVTPPETNRTKQNATLSEEERLSAEGINALPVSKRGWKLLGTIVTSRTKTKAEDSDSPSRAIIQIDGVDQPFLEGESVQGWKIALVQRRTVVLAKGPTKERLLMSDDPPMPQSTANPDVQKTLSRARLKTELGDVASLMQHISVSPQTVGGYQGLRIVTLLPGTYIEELGLRQDDLLLDADGKPLQAFGDLSELGNLADKDAITIEVLRNGKKTIIRYDVQS